MATRDYRPEIKQITKQWVKENCKNITSRDLGLLKLLYENNRRILRRDQIETLYPEFASTDRLNKRLKLLYKMHVIDRVYPPVGIGKGSSQQHICLDRAGIILLGLEKYNKPVNYDLHGNKCFPLGWEHKLKINDYKCNITNICKTIGAKILMYNVEKPIAYNGKKLIPDIFCMLQYNNKGYLFFIEVDMGTEDIPYIKKKIDSYKELYLSKQWITQEWNKFFKNPTFPRVLFMTENSRGKRLSTLRGYTSENPVRFIYDAHYNFIQCLLNIFNQ